jgi:hypothetical protein
MVERGEMMLALLAPSYLATWGLDAWEH